MPGKNDQEPKSAGEVLAGEIRAEFDRQEFAKIRAVLGSAEETMVSIPLAELTRLQDCEAQLKKLRDETKKVVWQSLYGKKSE